MLKKGHKAADAMDWNEAMQLVSRLFDNEAYRNALLVASGCYLGLRVSDLLRLQWKDLLDDEFTIEEKKTGKTRTLRVNPELQKYALKCRKALGRPSEEAFIFVAEGKDVPITRQAVDLMLKQMKVKYHK